jgi:hypothetical protein
MYCVCFITTFNGLQALRGNAENATECADTCAGRRELCARTVSNQSKGLRNLGNGAVVAPLYKGPRVFLMHFEATTDPACKVPSVQPW